MQNKIQGTHLMSYAPSSTPVKGGDLVKLGDSFYLSLIHISEPTRH